MSKEELPRKKKIRAGHRSSATRTLDQIKDAVKAIPLDIDGLLQMKLSLQEKLDTLKVLDGEILDLTPEAKVDQEIEQSDRYKEEIFRAMISIDKVLNDPPATVTAPHYVTGTRPATATSSTSSHHRVKLPKLMIRPFDGNLTKWITFWDSFESAIHNSEELSDVDKFNYLRSLLKEGAYDAISGLTLTSANYEEAIAILKKRYGDKQQIVSKHMDALLSMEAVTSPHNLKGLRQLYDGVESHIRSLKTLGKESSSYGSLLSPVLMSRLPQELRLIISRQTAGTEPTFDQLMKLFGDELEARKRAVVNTTAATQHRGQNLSTAATLITGKPATKIPCCYCQQEHSPASCKDVIQVNARKQVLRKAGRCFTCLRKGHISRNC